MTSAAILDIVLRADTSAATTALRRYQGQLGKVDKTVTTSTRTTSRLGDATKTTGSRLASAARYAAGAAAAYLSISQAKAAVETTQQLAGASATLSRNLGLTTKQASRWASVARTRDVDTKTLNASFTTLASNLADVRNGVDDAIDPFKALGVTQKDLQKDGNNFNKTLFTIADALDEAKGGAERQAAAADLLGRGYQNLVPIMGQGSDALREQLKLGDQYGATMGGKAVRAQTNLTAKLRESERAWQGLQVTFTEMITPALEDANEVFQQISRIMASDKLTNAEKFEKVGQIVGKWADKALDAFVAILPKLVERAAEAAPKIAKALVDGIVNSPAVGAFLLGGWLLKGAMLGAIGRSAGLLIGNPMGLAIAATAASAFAGAKLSDELLADVDSIAPMNASPIFDELIGQFGATYQEAVRLQSFMQKHPGLSIPQALEHIRRVPEDMDRLNESFRRGFDLDEAAQRFEANHNSIVANYGKGTRQTKNLSEANKNALAAHVADLIKREKISLDQGVKFLDRYGLTMKDLGPEFQTSSAKQIEALHKVGNAGKSEGQRIAEGLHVAQRAMKETGNYAKNMSNEAIHAFHDTGQSADKDLGKGTEKGSKHGRDLKKNYGGSVSGLAHTTVNAMENIGGNVNEALGKLGVQKKVKFSFKDMAESEAVGGAGRMRGGPIELAMGGLAALVPGRSTGDRHTLSIDGVPKAKVESGEGVFVGNRKMMGAAAAANAAVPRFATGGVAQPPGDPGSEVVQAAYASEVGQFLKRFGMDLTQGYNPSGPSVSPGHLQLDAAPSLDVVPLSGDWDGLFAQGLKWALSQGMQVGYDGQYGTQSWSGHGEGNHAHIDWSGGAGPLGAVVEKIKRQIIEGPDGPLKDIGQKAVDKTTAAANKWLAKQAPMADTQGIGAGVLSQDQIAGVWRTAGGAANKAHIASAIAMAESTGDPRAVSSAGARGLWQIMPFHGGGDRLFEPVFNAQKAIMLSNNGTDWASDWDVAGRAGQPVTYLQYMAEGGSIPELFPQLGSDDQDTRKDAQARILEKIGRFGMHPDTLTRLFQGTNALAEHQEYASLAAAGDITDANDNLIPGLFRSGTEHSWLLKAREEAWTLRENLINADTAMGPQIAAFENKDGLIKKAEKRLEQVRDALHDAQDKLKDLLEEIERQRKIIEDARAKLELTGNKELSESQKKHQRDRIDAAQKVIENITGQRVPTVENAIDRATRERDALVEPVIPALATKFDELKAIKEGIRGDSYTDELTGMGFDGLKTIQGTGSSMDLMDMPDDLHERFGGTLNDIQQRLLAMIPVPKPGDTQIDTLEAALALAGLTADLSDDIAAQSEIVTYWEGELARLQESGAPATEIGSAANSLQSARDALASLQETSAPEAPGVAETDSLRLEMLMQENARLRMSTQQAGTFAGFFKQFSAMPTFHAGGIMPGSGEQSARVLGGEGIFTREQMQAMGGRGDVTVNVNLDGMDVVVETFIGGVLAKETRKALGRGPTAGRKTAGRRS